MFDISTLYVLPFIFVVINVQLNNFIEKKLHFIKFWHLTFFILPKNCRDIIIASLVGNVSSPLGFRTPQYRNVDIERNKRVYIQLYRPSDQATSEPQDWEYKPQNLKKGESMCWRFSTCRQIANSASLGLTHTLMR